jgi:ACT domain-containing protein
MLRKLRRQLRHSHVLDSAIQETVGNIAHYLEPAVVDLQTEFRRALNEKEAQHRAHMQIQCDAKTKINFFENILSSVNKVEHIVTAVDTDERLTKGYIPM